MTESAGGFPNKQKVPSFLFPVKNMDVKIARAKPTPLLSRYFQGTLPTFQLDMRGVMRKTLMT